MTRTNEQTGAFWRVRKFARFISIYGLNRTLFKAAGRLRTAIPLFSLRRPKRDIAVIGCGQFSFATIGYFLLRKYGQRIATCYDVDTDAGRTFARAFDVAHAAASLDEVIDHPGLRTVYIASNHASHAHYAVQALGKGLDVYVEKPIAVSHDQLIDLVRASHRAGGHLFAGYNRPFASAVRLLRREMLIRPSEGISIQCFVAGHKIEPDHWYRKPEEGTRICGNLGHWLDLFVHILCWRGLPAAVRICLTIANENDPDDNLVVSLSSDRADICSVMMSSRCEPFEGVNETINIQHGETHCKIDDFRRMTLWQGHRLIRKRFRPKDVGHKLAILQPFNEAPQRDLKEVLLSTLLMLHIADMVRSKTTTSSFSFENGWTELLRAVESG